MAAVFSFSYIFFMYCLQSTSASVNTFTHSQDVVSEIQELKGFYLQQQSLIETMKLKIEVIVLYNSGILENN